MANLNEIAKELLKEYKGLILIPCFLFFFTAGYVASFTIHSELQDTCSWQSNNPSCTTYILRDTFGVYSAGYNCTNYQFTGVLI